MRKKFIRKVTFYEKYVKRLIDFCCALLAIILLFPVLAVIAGEGDGGFVALLGDDGLPVVNPAG